MIQELKEGAKLVNRFLGRNVNAAGKSAMLRSSKLGFSKADYAMLAPHAMMMPIDVYSRLQEGDDLATATIKSAGELALSLAFPVAYWSTFAASIGYDISVAAVDWWRGVESQYWSLYQKGTVGGGYVDTQQALTMRQAAVQAIQGSKLNARSALGGEARILSAGWFR